MRILSLRDRQPKVMDAPSLNPALRAQALLGLRRVHVISGTVSTLWYPLRAVARHNPGKTLRVLEVACGGGDLAIALQKEQQGQDFQLKSSR